MTQPVFPLEIKTLVIQELSPYDSVYGTGHAIGTDLKKAAYFRDLGAVCLVWPDTIAIVRKIIFKMISLRSNDHQLDSSLRYLCQALENDRNLSTYVQILEFSGLNTRRIDGVLTQRPPFIPTASHPLFLSFLSHIPKMHRLEYLRLDNMRFYEDNSLEFLNDLRTMKESSVKHINLKNITFSMSAFNTFLGYWKDKRLGMLTIDDISLIPDSSYRSAPVDVLEEESYHWDEDSDEDSGMDSDSDDTWTEPQVGKPSLWISELRLSSSGSRLSMLLDFLGNEEWSPLGRARVRYMHLNARGSTMTATTVIRINKLIRRFKLFDLDLDFEDYTTGTLPVLYLAGLRIAAMDFRITKHFALARYDQSYFNWYVKSLAAVPPNSRLRKFVLALRVFVPLEARDLELQGFWGILDEVLSGENLQLDTLTINVSLQSSPHGARTPALVQKLQTRLTEVCFPKVTAKYFRGNHEEIEGREMSALIVKYSEA